MKVTLVNNARSKIGGTSTYTERLHHHLHQKGIETRVLASDRPVGDLRFVCGLLVRKKPTGGIVHAQLPIYAAPYVFGKRGKVVVTLHGNNMLAIRRKHGRLISVFYNLLEGYALKRADLVIAVDESTKEAYLAQYPHLDISVIPVGIDLDFFKPLDRDEMRRMYGLDGLTILYVGRIREDKGIALIIDAFNLVRSRRPDAKLLLVGSGKDEVRFRKLAGEMVSGPGRKQAKGTDAIQFLGQMPQGQIVEVMSGADVFVLGSLYESGPLVVQEALACGLPCVATRVGRVAEFIRNSKCGRIVERDAEALAAGILAVSESGDVRNDCREAAMGFGFERTAGETLKLYGSLYAKEARPG